MNHSSCRRVGLFVPIVVLGLAVPGSSGQSIERVSVASDGTLANDVSEGASVSDDGAIVAFTSLATNLVAGDTNGVRDVFVRDRVHGTTSLVSVALGGGPADGESRDARVSGDGRFVVFTSFATNLVASDGNGHSDVFVRDLALGTTELVSRTATGAAGGGDSVAGALSSDGRFVVFTSAAADLVGSDANGVDDVFVRDRMMGTTEVVSVNSTGGLGNGASTQPAITRDGRYVAFTSAATNLSAGDHDSLLDVYRHDRTTGVTDLVSVGSDGSKADLDCCAPELSDDGHLVAFHTYAANLVFGDVPGSQDVFVRDMTANVTTCASLDSNGQLPPELVYVATLGGMSGDGKFVFYSCDSAYLVDPDDDLVTDVFCRTPALGMTTRPSVDANLMEPTADCFGGHCSIDGQFVVFDGPSDMVAGGTAPRDVFLRVRRLDLAYWNNYGTGFPGTYGVPSFTMSSLPQLNQLSQFLIENSSQTWTIGLLILGGAPTDVKTGLKGHLLVDGEAYVLLSIPPYGETYGDVVLPDEFLTGLVMYAQALQLDPGAAKGVSFSAGLELGLGY
jgi:Tol biopolymer transport system component